MKVKPLNTIEAVIQEYHNQCLSSNVGDWMSLSDARELILAIVTRDMLLNGGTVLEIEYEVVTE